MAKQKKNSNYQTDKAIAEKAKKEEQKKKDKQTKTIKITAICIGAAVTFIALVVGILFAVGAFDYSPEATYHATLNLDNGSSLHIELYGEDAPKTVENFIDLAEAGYFDGMYLHTFANGLLYGGSEKADGGSKGIKGEFESNGFENKIPMKKGVICMARGEDKNSAYDQFFILTKNNSSLKGDYAAFGKLTDLDALKDILKSIETDADGSITGNPPKITSISLHAAHH